MDFSNHLLLAVVFLVIGFVLLIKGADLFVEGSSSIAKKLNVPAMIIGLTIVAMGTSLPELAVSLTASMAGNNELAVSNVLGSNLFNLTVVIGVCALIVPVTVQKNTLQRDFPVSVISTILLFALGIGGMTIGHADGVILSALFVIFLILMVRSALKARKAALTEFSPEAAELELEEEEVSEDIRVIPVWRCILYIGLGSRRGQCHCGAVRTESEPYRPDDCGHRYQSAGTGDFCDRRPEERGGPGAGQCAGFQYF